MIQASSVLPCSDTKKQNKARAPFSWSSFVGDATIVLALARGGVCAIVVSLRLHVCVCVCLCAWDYMHSPQIACSQFSLSFVLWLIRRSPSHSPSLSTTSSRHPRSTYTHIHTTRHSTTPETTTQCDKDNIGIHTFPFISIFLSTIFWCLSLTLKKSAPFPSQPPLSLWLSTPARSFCSRPHLSTSSVTTSVHL